MRTLAILILALMMCGCDERQAPTEPSSNDGSIRARVLDFQTQAGVPGATVEFRREPQGADISATTDASGLYTIPATTVGLFSVFVNSASAGTVRVTGPAYRGDLLVDRGTCIARYGTIVDARTLRPVSGAAVSIIFGGPTAVSGADGWYRIDLGCPSTGIIGFNTTILSVTHPNYAPRAQVVGRGVQGVLRLDVDLQRP